MVLRSLTKRLGGDLTETYRNPNGVYMKLMNFHHFNEAHSGDGLKGGSKLDEQVYREFEGDHAILRSLALSIKTWAKDGTSLEFDDLDDCPGSALMGPNSVI